MYFYPVVISLFKAGEKDPKVFRSEISQLRTVPKLLAFKTELVLDLLKYDKLVMLFLAAWDSEGVITKIPLKRFLEAVLTAQKKCDSAR